MDIRRLSSVSMLSCAGLKRNIAAACSRLGEEFASIIQNLAELPMGESFDEEDIFESYRKNGCGQFALGRAFHWEKGQLSQVKHSDPIDQDDMIGYEFQRNAVVENTRVLLSGKPTNNVLLLSLIHISRAMRTVWHICPTAQFPWQWQPRRRDWRRMQWRKSAIL